jgi:hypothetical protein
MKGTKRLPFRAKIPVQDSSRGKLDWEISHFFIRSEDRQKQAARPTA